MSKPNKLPLSQARRNEFLNSPAFIKECGSILGSETFSRLSSLAIDEFIIDRSRATSEWEYKDNQVKIAGARDFISFLMSMVYDRLEVEDEVDNTDEAQFADD